MLALAAILLAGACAAVLIGWASRKLRLPLLSEIGVGAAGAGLAVETVQILSPQFTATSNQIGTVMPGDIGIAALGGAGLMTLVALLRNAMRP